MTEQYQVYFTETDADKRKQLLEDIETEEGKTPAVKLCRKLWEMRYVDPKSGRSVDLFLWELLELLCLYSTAGFMKKGIRSDAAKALTALGSSAAADYVGEGEEILYREYCNVVRLYLTTCESKSYRKRLFGLSELKESDWQSKVAKDMWRLSTGLPKRLDMTQEFSILSKAVKEEFCRQFENGETLLQEREEVCRHGKDKK